MSNTLKFGDGNWATKEDSLLAYNSENNNYKPLPFDFSRASSATRVNKDGLIETVGSGQPRIDFKDDSKGALLLEPTRTNLITYSEDFSQYSNSSINIVSNIATSPDGTVNATSLTNTVTGQSHIRTSFVAASTGNYTGTSYIKKQDFDFIYVELGNAFCWFNISNGTLGNSGNFGSGWTFISHSIESVGNDWYRFSITANNTITGTYNFRPYQPTSANANYTSGSLGSSFIWGTQLEQGSYPTSYIPTSGSVVTRLADSCSNGGNEQVINSTEGVLYFEGSLLNDDGTINTISLNDNTYSNNRLNLKLSSPSGVINGRFDSIGSDYNLSASGYDLTVNHKIALAYGLNNISLWVDGVKKDSLNTFSVFSNLIRLDFYNPFGGGSNIFNGNTKDVRVYNTALTDQELIALTTI